MIFERMVIIPFWDVAILSGYNEFVICIYEPLALS